jgi:hypothetical protein
MQVVEQKLNKKCKMAEKMHVSSKSKKKRSAGPQKNARWPSKSQTKNARWSSQKMQDVEPKNARWPNRS